MKNLILMAKSMDDGGGWMRFNIGGDAGTIEMNLAIKYTLLSEDVVGLE